MNQIENFPQEVIDRMLEYQVEQGNKKDARVFHKDKGANINDGGFSWNRTKEGNPFWNEVIDNENFPVFFDRYPKEEVAKTPLKYSGPLASKVARIMEEAKLITGDKARKIKMFEAMILANENRACIEVEHTPDGGLHLTEPENWPSFYNAYIVLRIAEICEVDSLVTIENGNVEIQIY